MGPSENLFEAAKSLKARIEDAQAKLAASPDSAKLTYYIRVCQQQYDAAMAAIEEDRRRRRQQKEAVLAGPPFLVADEPVPVETLQKGQRFVLACSPHKAGRVRRIGLGCAIVLLPGDKEPGPISLRTQVLPELTLV